MLFPSTHSARSGSCPRHGAGDAPPVPNRAGDTSTRATSHRPLSAKECSRAEPPSTITDVMPSRYSVARISAGVSASCSSRGDRCMTCADGASAVEVAVGALRPFQHGERALPRVGCYKPRVQAQAVFGEHACEHFHSCFAQHGDAPAAHRREWVGGSHGHARDAAVDDETCAWRCASPVRARLEGDVHRGGAERVAVGHGGYGVHFGVSLAAAPVPSFADYAPVGSHNHGAYHGVGCSVRLAEGCELQGAAHVFFVKAHRRRE